MPVGRPRKNIEKSDVSESRVIIPKEENPIVRRPTRRTRTKAELMADIASENQTDSSLEYTTQEDFLRVVYALYRSVKYWKRAHACEGGPRNGCPGCKTFDIAVRQIEKVAPNIPEEKY